LVLSFFLSLRLTLQKHIHTGLAVSDLCQGDLLSVHRADERRLNLIRRNDALTVPEHGITEGCQGRRRV
jgi:hypothetical protein